MGPLSRFWPLAEVGFARAYALAGGTAKSRRAAYEDFLALWKDTDPDVSVLQEAKRGPDANLHDPGSVIAEHYVYSGATA